MSIIQLLDTIKFEIEKLDPVPKKFLISKGSHNGFEKLVPEILEYIQNNKSFNFEYIQHYGHHFPDIDIKMNNQLYGIELKSRNNGAFDTNGNSVLESISTEKYDEIYIVFGSHNKKDNNPKIKVKYAPYWQATSSIVVTHSPRFKINMSGQDSVFESAEQYMLLRNKPEEEKVEFLQDYLRNNIEGTKWFTAKKQSEIKPVHIKSLNKTIKDRITCELLIIYPQDILDTIADEKPKANYNRSTEYLITQYFYYSTSLRDLFSAGGKWEFNGFPLPQVLKRFETYQEIFKEILLNANEDFKCIAYKSWKELNLEFEGDFKSDYFKVLDYLGELNYSQTLTKAKISTLSNLLDF